MTKVLKASNGRYYKKTREGTRFISDAEAARLKKKPKRSATTKRSSAKKRKR